MAWTRDLIRMAAEGENMAMRADSLASSNVDTANTGTHSEHYVTPEGLQQIADALHKKPSKSPHRTEFITAHGCRFYTALPWAD